MIVATFRLDTGPGRFTAEEVTALRQAIAASMTPTVAIAFMVFVLLYTPCLTTLAVIGRESGSWRWVGVSLGCSLIFAWGAAFVVTTFGGLFA